MGYELGKNIGIALKISDNYHSLRKGIRRIKKVSEPYIKSTFYIGSNCAETEVLGVRKYLRIYGTRFSGDIANDYIFSLYGKSGKDCRTEAFLFNRKDLSNGIYSGYTVPVTIVMKNSTAEGEQNESPFTEFECDIYINGEGVIGSIPLTEV